MGLCVRVIAACWLCFLPLCNESRGQQTISSATVGGRVEDSASTALPGANVSIKDLDRGQGRAVLTDRKGLFQFLYLPPGHYELRVTAAHFAPVTRELELAAGQAFDIPIRLALAKLNETIEVRETGELLESVRTQTSETISPTEINSLPLNGRNYLDLALLVPGVSRTNTGAPQQFAETSAVPGTGLSVASQRNLYNNFVVDGFSANDDAASLAGTFFSQEVIREFQVITAGSNAEFGRSASGVVNIATRSGSNNWHGTVYDFFRNERFDARNALATRKDPLTQSQYGATLAGPIVKDRTFLFSNFEQTRRQAAGFVSISPANVASINRALSQTTYAGPVLSTGEFATGIQTSEYFARLDHQINDSNQLMIRYNLYDISSPNSRNVGSLNDVSRGTSLHDRDQTIGVSEIATLSSRSLNELRVAITNSRLSAPGNDVTGPAVNISGVASFGPSTTSPTGRDNNLYQLTDSISTQRGSHFLKAGADFEWNRLNINFPGNALAATYAFASLAGFQSGTYSTFTQAFGPPGQFQSNPNLGLFAQDEWKATANLTIHSGVRYDVQYLPSPIQTQYRNVAPRIGLAWSPRNRGTVIRAGYGMFYDRVPLRATSNALQRDGTKYRAAVLSYGQLGAPTFPLQLSIFPPNQYVSITTIDSSIKNGYAHQINFQIEHEIASSTFLAAGYQWTRGLHLILARNLNVPILSAAEAARLGIPNLGRPNSLFGNISQYESAGDSYYNGLLLSMTHRMSKQVSLRLSYNFSKGIDDIGNNFFAGPQNNNNLRDDRGLSDSDQRHRLALAAVLQSPLVGNRSWWHALLEGWQLSPLFTYTSALPFNVQLNFDRNNDTNLNDRPIGVGRNTGRGFSFMSFDMRLSRQFKFSEGFRLQALAESFNTLNTVNRALPNNIIGSGAGAPLLTFGQATAVYDPRQIQLGLRLEF